MKQIPWTSPRDHALSFQCSWLHVWNKTDYFKRNTHAYLNEVRNTLCAVFSTYWTHLHSKKHILTFHMEYVRVWLPRLKNPKGSHISTWGCPFHLQLIHGYMLSALGIPWISVTWSRLLGFNSTSSLTCLHICFVSPADFALL